MSKPCEILLFFIVILISCNTHTSKADTQDSYRDSIVKQYISQADSFSYFDTTDVHYKLLKAHLSNDTTYLRKRTENLSYVIKTIPKELQFDSCAKVPSLRTLDADEAYRFVFVEAFDAYKTNITVSHSSGNTHLHFIIYKPKASATPCELIKEFDKQLTTKQWESIKQSLHYGDFWGLSGANGYSGLDGSSLYVDGFLKGQNATEDRLHRVYRWIPSRNAIGDTYKLVYQLSGFVQNQNR